MASTVCTINSVKYSRSDWLGEWQDDGDHRVAAGYAHTRSNDNDWGWWRTQITLNVPQFTGSSSALIFKLTTDTTAFPVNSYAILRKTPLTSAQVGTLTKVEANHACPCTNKTKKSHEIFSNTALSGIIGSSFSFSDEAATKLPEDNTTSKTIYYRFNSSSISSGVYYIYILYKHRQGTYHGYVAGTKYSSYLLFENNKSLSVTAKINNTSVTNFGNYANVTINNVKCSTYSNALTYNSSYRIGVVVPSDKANYYKYVGNTPITANLTADTNVVLEFKTKSKICFNGNGGTCSTSTMYKIYGEDVTLPTASRSGYSFDGWYTSKNDGSFIGIGNAKYSTDPTSPLKNNLINSSTYEKTLYAQWSANEYTVTFDTNGGSISDSTKKTVEFDSQYGNLPMASKTGYNFDGWYTSKDGGTKVTPTTPVNVASDHTLYARYTTATYTITYNPNNGEKSSQVRVTYGGSITIASSPKKIGSKFKYWKVSSEETTFHAGQSLHTYPYGRSIILDAEYDDEINTIRLLNGGVWRIIVPHVYSDGSWKPIKTKLWDGIKFEVFDYYNWLS